MWQGAKERCTVQGHTLAYHSEGTGTPVVMVHGITTYSFIWRNIIPHLCADHRVIAVDLLGCGASDCPLDVEYSLKNHADILTEFVDTLGLDRFHLVGHDVGGGIAQIMTVRSPERLLDVTLMNTVAYDFWPVQPIVAMRTPILRQLAMASMDFGTLKLVVRRGMYHRSRATDELLEYFWAPMKRKDGRKAFLHFARCLNNQDLLGIEEDIKKIDTPVLIIRGTEDVYLSAAIARRLHSDIAGSELIEMEQCGHFMQEDEPERIGATLRNFFDRT